VRWYIERMAEMSRRQAGQSGVNVVERAVFLQQLVAAAEQPLALRELARRSDLAPSTVSRLARTLEGLSLVERDVHGRYVLGAGADTLSGAASAARAPVSVLDIVLRRVVDHFDESATTSVDAGNEVVYLGCRGAGHDVSVPDVTGQSSPFHLLASGIVLMTAWDQDRIDEYLGRELHAATSASVTDSEKLRDRVDSARDNGFAWSIGESVADITALAVPVLDHNGEMIASIGLYGPSFRLTPEDLDLPPRLQALVASTTAALNI